ncbi:thioredoxin domain-containing protein [Vibrio anguillarum]|uniref:Thioredoxin domain-containing protein n=1 Tax=Vibrio anguillarum TaxID=55601 RepID=A0ABD4QRK6_VIBAN|nr:thioredoxin domain-containing protein [Vibrio anguillarum]ASG05562.1 thiol-disulfide isomerase [Vibrio anguillarum]MBT2917854.1 thioredoxin domain-containing protein [Vibrio anguillarum]
MKKNTRYWLALITTLLILAGCGDNTTPQKGKQYDELPVSLATYRLPAVTEVFSLTCGHCRSMEKVIPELEKITGETFGKLHVTFNEGAQIGAMIYYSAVMQLEAIPDHAMMEQLFSVVQMDEEVTLSERKEAIDLAFSQRGLISPYSLDDEQQKQLFQEIQLADDISVKGQINAVPTFIVKGKYLVITSGHKDAADIANTISYLLTHP